MATPSTCLNCGAPLVGGARQEFCPKCLFLQASAGLLGPALNLNVEDQESEVSTQNSAVGVLGGASAGANRKSEATHRFGDYELLEEIGRGGMGVVFRARQRSLDRVVAIKMMAFGPNSNPDLVKRFRAEAVSAASLHHPNIVAIHEVGIHEDRHFFVMDYVEGQSLARLVGNQPLPVKRAAVYLQTIAEAVHYAHERGILHRDLKPSNVLIDAQDQPHVVDFGLARQLEGDSELTVTGQVLGSPQYLPPEQAAGPRGRVSRPTDVYALGATLYHLLTGRPPFQAESLAQTLDLVLHAEPVAPRLLNPGAPRDLQTICLKCLEKEPARRYPTAQALAEELARFLAGELIQARPLGPAGKAWRWCRRKPQLASLAAVAALLFLMGFAGVLWQWRRAESERQRAGAGELLARQNAYAADMKEVQRTLEDSDLGCARELLNRYRPVAKSEMDLRGWEWRYFWSHCQSDERITLCQYSNAVSALAFSPDGKWLAVRREGGAIALWDAVAKRSVTNLPGAGLYKALAFSPRADLLAWGNKDASGVPVVSLWDVSAQKEVAQLLHSAAIVSVAFSPDAKEMATLAYDGTVRLWDIASRQVVRQFPSPKLDWGGSLNFEADTESTAANAPLRTAPVYSDHYGCVVFSPDGRMLALGEAKARIRLLERTSGMEKIIQVDPPADGIAAMAFSPDRTLLAAACGVGDNQVHVWDLRSGTELRPLTGHSRWVVGLAFSPDGKTLASASADQTIRLWDVAGNAERRRFQGYARDVWAIAWSPDGKELVTGGKDGSVRYWAPEAKPTLAPPAVLPTLIWPWGLAFSANSKTLLTVTRPEGSVVRWDATNFRGGERLSWLGTNHAALTLSPDGRWIVLSEGAENIQVWDFMAQRMVTNLVSPQTKIFTLIFSPHGTMLAAGARSSQVGYAGKLWTVAGWREMSLQGINRKNHGEAGFSPNERTLALAYMDGTAAWWDLGTGQRQAFFDSRYSSGPHVAFSPDGRFFATAGVADGLITVWDRMTPGARRIIRDPRDALHDLGFSPDGQRLVASGSSSKDVVTLWDVETGRDVATLPGAPRWYPHVGFSPDGNTLFAASLEGVALFWHAPSLTEIEAKEKEKRAQ
ncbi:MAG: protein kinase [Verrucomicrobiia bacterium]